MDEGMNVMEMLDAIERDGYNKLKMLSYDDPLRGKLLNEMKVCSEIRIANDQSDQNRLNNNRRNDIEEQRLQVESEKVKNERKRMGVDIIKNILLITGGIIAGTLSYNMEELRQKFAPLNRFGDRLIDRMGK